MHKLVNRDLVRIILITHDKISNDQIALRNQIGLPISQAICRIMSAIDQHWCNLVLFSANYKNISSLINLVHMKKFVNIHNPVLNVNY